MYMSIERERNIEGDVDPLSFIHNLAFHSSFEIE